MWGLDHSKGKEEIITWTLVAIVMLIGPDRRSTSVLCVFVGGYSVPWWCHASVFQDIMDERSSTRVQVGGQMAVEASVWQQQR